MEAQEQEQGQQPQYPPMQQNYNTPMNSLNSTVLYLTNPEPIIQELILTLRCQYKDEDGNIKSYGEPLLNDEGLHSVITHIRPFLNQSTAMSNIDENEIQRLIVYQYTTVICDLMINRTKYGIKGDAERTRITKAVSITSKIMMNRAIMGAGNEKRFYQGTTQEITYNQPTKPSKNMFDMFSSWGN